MSGRTLRWALSRFRSAEAFAGRDGTRNRLTILRHHRVHRDGDRPLDGLGVSESVLRAQVEMLRALGLGPITVAEGLARLEEDRPGHWVAMSFDDGYADNVYLALPILKAVSARASFYLTAGLIEGRRAPWWDVLAHALANARVASARWSVGQQVVSIPLGDAAARRRALTQLLGFMRVPPREQAERLTSLRALLGVREPTPCELGTWEEISHLLEAGMEIGAHTLDHPFLSLVDPSGQLQEIRGSLELIEKRLGVRTTGLAYPGGDYDQRTVEATRQAGLSYAVTTRAGDNRPGADRFELRRRGMYEGACLDPWGRFSRGMMLAELDGAFDRMRQTRRVVAS